jgi:D-aspartate ligase
MQARPATQPSPVVLGEGITALGVLRSLSRSGLQPILVSAPGDFASRSRRVRGRTLAAPDSIDRASLVGQLEKLGVQAAVLIPCTDPWCQAVSDFSAGDREPYVTSLPDRETTEMFLDKWLLSEALERFEIPHPTTFKLTSETQLAQMSPSFFLKPRHSAGFYDTFGRKAFGYRNRDEATDAFRRMTSAGFAAVLQERVPGPPNAHVFIDGFIDRGGVRRALFVRERIRMFPSDFGNSSMTVSVAPDTHEDAIDSVDRLLTGVGFRGAFSAEFKRDPRDGIAKLVEVNCRPWWYIGFAAQCGVDITLMIYRDALGLPVASVETYPVGERCGVLVDDVKAYIVMRRSGELTLRRWVQSWIGSTTSTFELDDPLPTLVAMSSIARRRLARHRPREADG